MKISIDSKEAMKRFEMLFFNENRECIFQKPVPEFTVLGQKFGPFQKGDNAELPNWVIERLLKEDYIDIAPRHAYESYRQLQNIFNNIRKGQQAFLELQPFFYRALARKSLRLQSDKTSTDPRKYEEAENFYKMIRDIVETRSSQILLVADSDAYRDNRQQMTLEERWLCEEITGLLSGWRQNIVE